MAYDIISSSGILLVSIPDGTIDTTTTSLALPGKNAANFGQLFNQNSLYLLQNSANAQSPANPRDGQLWYDTATGRLRLRSAGLWADQTGQVLPQSGNFVANVSAINRAVVCVSQRNIASITSYKSGYFGYSNIAIDGSQYAINYPARFLSGVNLPTTSVFNGNATNTASLTIPRYMSLVGSAQGNAVFDGSNSISITTHLSNVTASGYSTNVVVDDGGTVIGSANLTALDITTALSYVPFDTANATITASSNTVVFRDHTASFAANLMTGTAKLTQSFSSSPTLGMIGSVTGNTVIDGTGNAVINSNLSLTSDIAPGIYNSVTVNESGFVTGGSYYDNMPIGSIVPYLETYIPNGWLICDGSTSILPDGSTVTTPNISNLYVGHSNFIVPNVPHILHVYSDKSVQTNHAAPGSISCQLTPGGQFIVELNGGPNIVYPPLVYSSNVNVQTYNSNIIANFSEGVSFGISNFFDAVCLALSYGDTNAVMYSQIDIYGDLSNLTVQQVLHNLYNRIRSGLPGRCGKYMLTYYNIVDYVGVLGLPIDITYFTIALQDELMLILVSDYGNRLNYHNIYPSDENIFGAHYLGFDQYVAVMKAPRTDTVGDTLTKNGYVSSIDAAMNALTNDDFLKTVTTVIDISNANVAFNKTMIKVFTDANAKIGYPYYAIPKRLVSQPDNIKGNSNITISTITVDGQQSFYGGNAAIPISGLGGGALTYNIQANNQLYSAINTAVYGTPGSLFTSSDLTALASAPLDKPVAAPSLGQVINYVAGAPVYASSASGSGSSPIATSTFGNPLDLTTYSAPTQGVFYSQPDPTASLGYQISTAINPFSASTAVPQPNSTTVTTFNITDINGIPTNVQNNVQTIASYTGIQQTPSSGTGTPGLSSPTVTGLSAPTTSAQYSSILNTTISPHEGNQNSVANIGTVSGLSNMSISSVLSSYPTASGLGAYQISAANIKNLAAQAGIPLSATFNTATQAALAAQLMSDNAGFLSNYVAYDGTTVPSPTSTASLQVSWLLGGPVAADLLTNDTNTLATDALPTSFITGNPAVFKNVDISTLTQAQAVSMIVAYYNGLSTANPLFGASAVSAVSAVASNPIFSSFAQAVSMSTVTIQDVSTSFNALDPAQQTAAVAADIAKLQNAVDAYNTLSGSSYAIAADISAALTDVATAAVYVGVEQAVLQSITTPADSSASSGITSLSASQAQSVVDSSGGTSFTGLTADQVQTFVAGGGNGTNNLGRLSSLGAAQLSSALAAGTPASAITTFADGSIAVSPSTPQEQLNQVTGVVQTTSDNGGGCFAAGSLIAMADGALKPIETIAVGDTVLGAFGETNTVLALLHTKLGRDEMMIEMNGEHHTSENHPHVSPNGRFYAANPASQIDKWSSWWYITLPGREIVPAYNRGLSRDRLDHLEIGVELQTTAGAKQLVSLRRYPAQDLPLYNLIVDNSHTFYVNGYCVTGWPREDDFDYDSWVQIHRSDISTYTKPDGIDEPEHIKGISPADRDSYGHIYA